MGKVLLAALVLMLACSPAIGANTSTTKGKDIKKIKVYKLLVSNSRKMTVQSKMQLW
jgi:hypothetical protein